MAERIASASPVIPHSAPCLTSASTATGAHPFDPASHLTPMSAPPLVKHRRLSSQLPARSATSMLLLGVPGSPACRQNRTSQHLPSQADHNHLLCSMELGSAEQQHESVGRMTHRSQPNSKQPGKNLLTRWLATGTGKPAAAVGTPSRLCAHSPVSAVSVAATKPGANQMAAVSTSEERDMRSPIPMMPFTDVTNVVDDSAAADLGSAIHAEPCHAVQSSCPILCHDRSSSDRLSMICQPQMHIRDDSCDSGQAQHSGQMLAAGEAVSGHQLPRQQERAIVRSEEQQVPSGSVEVMPQGQHGFSVSTTASQKPGNGEQHSLCQLVGSTSPAASKLHPVPRRDVVMTDRSKSVKAACGIKVMWVSAQARRRGIATQLLDTARLVVHSPQHVNQTQVVMEFICVCHGMSWQQSA